MKDWTVTPEEARELGQMVAGYDGSPARARELLEALVIVEQDLVPPSSCTKSRHDRAARIRDRRAA